MNSLTVFFDQFFQSAWTQSVGWALLHSLWQITLIAALYAVAAVALRKRSASLRYIVGCVAMAGMLIVPFATFFVLPNPIEPDTTAVVDVSTVQSSDSIKPLLVVDQPQVTNAVPVMQTVTESNLRPQPSNVASIVEQPSLLEQVSLFVQPWLPIATITWLPRCVITVTPTGDGVSSRSNFTSQGADASF